MNSAIKVLVAGTEPRLVVADDFDDNGSIDLAVAGGDDINPKLRIFFNMSPPQSPTPGKVDIAKFSEVTANPLPLPPGTVHTLLASDINGDAFPDLVVAVKDRGAVLRFSVGHYLNPNQVDSVKGQLLSPARTGTLVMMTGKPVPRSADLSMRVGDMNGDTRPDIVIGWDTVGSGDKNLRVLFGNN